MYKKLLFVVLIIEVFLYIFMFSDKKNIYRYVKFKINKININDLKLENYVIGVVAAEMPATFSYESLRAQAVVSRTFAYQKIISGNISYDELQFDKAQAYITKKEMKDKWKSKYDDYYKTIKSAVNNTKGEIIVYNGKPIKAYYFSTSNGVTENSKSVFGEEEYLVSVDSSFDKYVKDYEIETEFSVNDFLNKLGIDEKNIIVGEIKKSSTNHVESLVINSRTFSGLNFRKMLNLRSTDFDIFVDKDKVKIITRGYGHGVGMSQYGANYLASKGQNYKEIIKYFYHNVEIIKM